MSSSEAQRSLVHHATEDSSVEPNGPAGVNPPPGADAKEAAGQNADADATPFGGGPLIGDSLDADGPRRSPELFEGDLSGGTDDLAIRNDPDESTFGGPLKLDADDGV